MAVSWAIPHCFGVPAPFLGHVTLGTRFKGAKLKTRRFRVLWLFHGLFHNVLGSRAISRPHDSRYTV
jgi:hypothetical protein